MLSATRLTCAVMIAIMVTLAVLTGWAQIDRAASDPNPIAGASPRTSSPAVAIATLSHRTQADALPSTDQLGHCSCPVTAPMGFPTAGLFNDQYDTGNGLTQSGGHLEHDSVAQHAGAHGWMEPAGKSDAPFESFFERASEDKRSPQCYYRIRNFCVIHGALVLYLPQEHTKSNFGSFRLCNDLKGKINLRFSIEAPRKKPPIPLSSQPAHVAACWQFYGYHLFLCLASLYDVQAVHNMSNVRIWLYNHAQSLPRISRNHYSNAMYLGSSGSFDDSTPEKRLVVELAVRPSKYWKLWSQNTRNPEDVSELKKFPYDLGASSCFARGLIGQPDPRNLTTASWRRHAQRLRKVFHLSEPSQSRCSCDKMHVVISQRNPNTSRVQGLRLFLNVDEMITFIRQFTPHSERPSSRFTVEVVDWATLSVQRQAEVAASADVMLAMHGAGNAWLALQRPRSVFVEVWPGCLARNVYLMLSQRLNMRYYALCHDYPTANFMHQNVQVSLKRLGDVLQNAWQYLLRTRCCQQGVSTPFI